MAATTSTEIAALGAEMLRFACSGASMKKPDEVLDCLHQVSFQHCKINVLLAGLFPLRWGDMSSLELGKNRLSSRQCTTGLVGGVAGAKSATSECRTGARPTVYVAIY